jgi:hypothetical protein
MGNFSPENEKKEEDPRKGEKGWKKRKKGQRRAESKARKKAKEKARQSATNARRCISAERKERNQSF